MVSKRKTKVGKVVPYVDVRSNGDIPKFESMLHLGPVLVLVYADWCGHCQNFKKNMWDEVANSQEKQINTAAVHFDMVDKTSMKNANIEGYPTLFEVKKTPAQANVATPIATPQTKQELKTIVNSMNELSQRIQRNSQAASQNMKMEESGDAVFTPETIESLPPEMEPITQPEAQKQVTAVQGGGSLFESLLKVSADAAHAIVLTGSAIEISRRMKKRRQTKRKVSKQKKQTRRR